MRTVRAPSSSSSFSPSVVRLCPVWHLLAHAVCQDAEAFVSRLREVEVSDPIGRRWPRSKPNDDATAFVLTRPATLDGATLVMRQMGTTWGQVGDNVWTTRYNLWMNAFVLVVRYTPCRGRRRAVCASGGCARAASACG